MRMSGLAAIACISLLLGCAAPSPGQSQPGATEAREVIGLINQRRAEAGCSPVSEEDRLTAAARRQAVDMRDNGVHDHTGSDGSSPQQRIVASGFPATATGEILLWGTGSTSPQGAVDAWMGSPPHREVIEQCSFTHAGAAVLQEQGDYFAAVTFARTA